MLKDFDVTEINKDTRAIVFSLDFSSVVIEDARILNEHLKRIHNELDSIGIKALFISDRIQITPLSDDIIKNGNLKTF